MNHAILVDLLEPLVELSEDVRITDHYPDKVRRSEKGQKRSGKGQIN